ncbi:hypothetical protein LJC17_04550 [Acholeplasma sp. OttesenSCG-928-E16]|nr:hypothetical protein [Acholeplasma sp. OttesenSCG-928-E16]
MLKDNKLIELGYTLYIEQEDLYYYKNIHDEHIDISFPNHNDGLGFKVLFISSERIDDLNYKPFFVDLKLYEACGEILKSLNS